MDHLQGQVLVAALVSIWEYYGFYLNLTLLDLMSLKELMSAEVVKRVQYNEIPPRVKYSLTENGEKLIEALDYVTKWSEETLNLLKKNK